MRDRRRTEFPSLAQWTYLLSHSLGPMPRGARESLNAYLRRWEEYGSDNAWKAEWWDLSARIGERPS